MRLVVRTEHFSSSGGRVCAVDMSTIHRDAMYTCWKEDPALGRNPQNYGEQLEIQILSLTGVMNHVPGTECLIFMAHW